MRPISVESSEMRSGEAYEAPEVFPIGHLHDLLAGGGTQNCDFGDLEAGPQPEASPGVCP